MSIIVDTITASQASAAIVAAQRKAIEIGVAANIAVLDAGAHLKAFARMDSTGRQSSCIY